MERTIATRLKMNVSDFKAGARAARSELDELIKKSDKNARVAETGLGRLEQSVRLQRDSWNTASTAALGWGVAVTAAVGGVVKVYATFDQAMSNVQAATHESTANMALLRQAAIDAGASTVFSATESAGAVEELAKAGMSTTDILGGGLQGALDMAAAGNWDVGASAEAAASAMVMFNLKGSDMSHVADLMAAGAGKAQGEISDLSAALNNVGPVASSMGLSIEEVTGFLAMMASNGLVGAEAGTQMKSMLLALQGPSSKAQKALDDLGVSMYDNAGNTKSLTQFVGEYKASLEGKTQAEKDSYNSAIFGSYGINAVNVALKSGSEGLQQWIDDVNDAGYAAETADIKLDNLAGDWEGLTGSIESVVLKSGSGLNDFLRDVVQGLETFVDIVGQVPAPVLGAVTGLTAFVGVGGLVVGAGMKMATSAYDVYRAWTSLASTAPDLAGKISAVTKVGGAAAGALAVAAAAYALYADHAAKAEQRTQQLITAMDGVADAERPVKEVLTDMIAMNELDWGGFQRLMTGFDTLPEALDWAGVSIGEFVDAMYEGGESLDSMKARLESIRDTLGPGMSEGQAITELISKLDQGRTSVEKSEEATRRAADAHAELEESADGAADAQDGVASSTDSAADAMQTYADAISEAMEGLEALAGIAMSYDEAQIRYAETLREASSGIDDWIAKRAQQLESDEVTAEAAQAAAQAEWDAAVQSGEALDLTTEKGAITNSTLLDVANRAWDLVTSFAETGASGADLGERMETLRQDFINQAMQMGFNETQAGELADRYGLIPSEVRTQIIAEDQATEVISAINYQLSSLPTSKRIEIESIYRESSVSSGGRGHTTMDDGGILSFANGGTRLPSAATIQAPYGAAGLVQWAEPGTDGEAYIPLAASKRARSESILAEVAHRFGGQYVKSFADGGFSAASVARGYSGTPSIQVVVYSQNPFTGEQVKAMVASTTVQYLGRR